MKGLNNKILIIVLIVLIAAFVLTKLFRSPALEANLDADVLKVDTARITEIMVYPLSDQRKEIKLIRNGNTWKTSQDKITGGVESHTANNLLRSLASLKPSRIVAHKQDKWNEYSVGDTTGIQVKVLHENDELATLWIGRENDGQTYVRRGNSDEVYSVFGVLQTTFNKKFNDWRDKSFLRVYKDSVTKIVFQYPADSGFVVSRNVKGWTIGSEPADSIKVERFLNGLSSKKLTTFADDFMPTTKPQVTISLENDEKPMAVVNGWSGPADQWILASDVQEGVYFSDKKVDDLFAGKKKFLAGKSN